MKIHFRYLFLLCVIVCLSFPANAFSYYITFTGSGASSTVDSVVVQNLYQGTQVTVPGGSQLRLTDEESSIGILKTITDFACVYPNPITDNATYSFVAKNDGNTQISVYGLDGRKVTGMDIDLLQGKHSFQLTLPKGVYLVQAKGNAFSYSTKIISLSMTDYQPDISYNGNLNNNKLQKVNASDRTSVRRYNATDNKPQKVGAPEVKLQYATGDQLLYKAYSGIYCTIVTDKPTETKTTDFKFVDCTDADGNHYAVVHIGEQTWMAENLKTTKYRNGEEIGTTDPLNKDIQSETEPKYQWAYNGDENNPSKFGRLYTWYAVNDNRNIAPFGWHVVSDAEWTTLENYLIANGYNFNGATTDNKIGKALASNTDWTAYTETGSIGNDLTRNNKSGFSALPGGYRLYDGTFHSIGDLGHWWSSTESHTTNGWFRYLLNNYASLSRHFTIKINSFSVRCVKDNSNPLNIATSYIPAGTFTMGSPEAEASRYSYETQHSVTLSAFLMSKYEILNSQYAVFLNTKGIGSDGMYPAGEFPTQTLVYVNSTCGLTYSGTQWKPVLGCENAPVINVTWYGATEFATYVGGTLPTEAQWEYACRAGTTTPFNTGDCLTNTQANYYWAYPYSTCSNTVTTYPGKTQSVGTYAPNGYGLYDMHGNVWEWCSDWYDIYPDAAQINPTGAILGSSRVIRSGSWSGYAESCRSACRASNYPSTYNYEIGFRIVFTP